jgi:hypothetical protein
MHDKETLRIPERGIHGKETLRIPAGCLNQ